MTDNDTEVKIIYATEGITASAAKDIISIAVILAAFWANHEFVGDNIILSLLLAFLAVGVMFKYAAKHIRIVHIDALPEDLRRPEK